jgi:hypothetical protein
MTKEQPKLIKFPSEFIWVTSIKEHKKIKKEILPKIKKDIKTLKNNVEWHCEIISSFGQHKEFLLDEFFLNQIVWNSMDEMLNNLDFWIKFPKKSYLEEIWYNHYEKNIHYQETHHHRPSDFSGIYFIELEGKNTTTFYHHHISQMLEQNKTLDKIKEGDVVIFPSSLMHSVRKSNCKKTSISFNINCQF